MKTQMVPALTVGPYVMQSSSAANSEVRCPEHVDALMQSLRKRARRGVRVEAGPIVLSSPVQLDVVVSSARERVGIICDQGDARKMSRHGQLLDEMFVDRVYLCSTLDTIMDPEGVAANIVAGEPGLFNGSSRTMKRTPRVSRMPRTARRAEIRVDGRNLPLTQQIGHARVTPASDQRAA